MWFISVNLFKIGLEILKKKISISLHIQLKMRFVIINVII